MKRVAVTLLVILTLVIALVGCGKSESASGSGDKSGGKTTITFGFWGAAEDLKVYTNAAKEISKEYPNIELKVKQYPSSEQFWNNLPGEIAAGVAPDFIKISNEGAFEYINKGLFTPLDDLTASAKVDMKRYNPAGADIWKVDGKQYGLPFNQMPAMFFINTDMWKKAGLGEYPTTWDEVETAAKKLKTKDVYGIGLNLHPLHITNVTKSYGGDWGNGKTINSPENVEGLQKVLDLYKSGLAVTPKTLGYGWDGEVFANGKAAMTTGGNWYKGYLKDANPKLKYAVIPVPKGTVNASTMISDAYVVLKDTKNKKEALQAAYYLTNENVQKDFMKTGVNPSIPSLSAKYFEENPEFKEVQKALEYSTDFGYPKETKKFNDELIKQLEDVILGGNDKSAKEILNSIQQQF